MKDLDKVISDINEVTKLDILTNTRKTDYVEARAILIYIMRNEFLYTVHQIASELTKRGFKYTHSSVVLTLQKFDMYLATSPIMRVWYNKLYIVDERSNEQEKETKIRYIKNKIPHFSLEELEKLNDVVREIYEESIIRNTEVEYELC